VTRQYISVVALVLAWLLLMVRLHIQEQMQRVVARMAPPKTNRPFKNFAEATNASRVRREYFRLVPVRAKKKFLLMRILALTSIVCLVIGIFTL
jgi:hypothetical protein